MKPTDLARPVPIAYGSPTWKELSANKRWVAQPKFNGWRCMADTRGGLWLWSRHGVAIKEVDVGRLLWGKVMGGLSKMEGMVIDGEICKDKGYFAFDVLVHGGVDVRSAKLCDRLLRLQEICEGGPLNAVLGTVEGKDGFYKRCLTAGHEGVVLKCLDAGYPPGDGAVWVKVKP